MVYRNLTVSYYSVQIDHTSRKNRRTIFQMLAHHTHRNNRNRIDDKVRNCKALKTYSYMPRLATYCCILHSCQFTLHILHNWTGKVLVPTPTNCISWKIPSLDHHIDRLHMPTFLHLLSKS